MKISDISYYLFESYKDAKEKFSQEESEDVVNQYLDTFKQLAKKGIVTGQEKDIGYWIKQGWYNFKDFVDSKSQEQTQSQVKKSKKKDAIIALDDEEKLVVIPLSKDASCFYGKGTRWCTASTESENHFNNYFHVNKIILIYVFKKNSGEKYAAAYSEKTDNFEYFDELDESISKEEFKNKTDISIDQLRNIISQYKDSIYKHMDINKLSAQDKIDVISEDGTWHLEKIFEFDNLEYEVVKFVIDHRDFSFKLLSLMDEYNENDEKYKKGLNIIHNLNKDDLFTLLNNFYSKVNNAPNIDHDVMLVADKVFYSKYDEETILDYIKQIDDRMDDVSVNKFIYLQAVRYVSEKTKVLEISLENKHISMLHSLIQNNAMNDTWKETIRKFFSTEKGIDVAIDMFNIGALSPQTNFGYKKIVDLNIVTKDNIDDILNKLLNEHSLMLLFIDEILIIKLIEYLDIETLNIKPESVREGLEQNADPTSFKFIFEYMNDIPNDIKFQTIKYIVNSMILGDKKYSKDKLKDSINKTIIDNENLLGGVLHPLDNGLQKDIMDYVMKNYSEDE